ncbi:MAG: pirin family protein [Acidimicrobiia bacterium]|nr:pirin family protein [Acidimicrobiia bacterium]
MSNMRSGSSILATVPLGPQWPTMDPFLFCAHHDDHYPAATLDMAPDAPLGGRAIGQDFSGKDGWSMYHGTHVPGFPQHPHRGFETITFARSGVIDHSDSLGATARFGRGDAQWMTAGSGIVHSEMFPLLRADAPNHTELFQVWLNLPAADKLVDPYFTMLWAEDIPTLDVAPGVRVTTIVGGLDGIDPPAPPPDSWARRPDAQVAMWHLELAPESGWELPPTDPRSSRILYVFEGNGLRIESDAFGVDTGIQLTPDRAVRIDAGEAAVECLLLQGVPIAEPVAQYGPFVMNTKAEIEQAFDDYERTRFGGWPWDHPDPVHDRDRGRFAIHADGQHEEAPDRER